MNLHDINEKPQPWGLVHPYALRNVRAAVDEMGRNTDEMWREWARELTRQPIVPIPDYQREWLRYYRNQPVRLRPDPLMLYDEQHPPTFETVEVRMQGDRMDNRAALDILRELDWQYMRVREWRARATDMQRVAFVITQFEWDVLRRSLDWHELQAHMGAMAEGTAPTYRGYPLVIR